MPTGYTADVQDGKVTEFSDFALICARAFGALVNMRDEPHNAPIPEAFDPHTSYHDEMIAAAQATLTELAPLTAAECEQRTTADHADRLEYHSRRMREREEQRVRYEAMLAKAEVWEAPTPDHEGLRQFMIDQLKKSIDSDCAPYPRLDREPERLTGEAWRNIELSRATDDLAYHVEQRDKEIARTATRNAWLAALRASLNEGK